MAYGSSGFTPTGSQAGAGNLGTTTQSADVYLKQIYIDNQNLNSLMYDDPVLGMLNRLPASNVVEGKEMVVPIRIGRSPSGSKDFTKAQQQAQARTGARGRWIIPIDEDFQVGRVSNKAIKSSKSSMGAFVKLLVDETDAAIAGLKEKRCAALFAPEYGTNTAGRNAVGVAAAQVASSAKVYTVADRGNISAFDLGDTVVVLTSSGGAVANSRAGIVTKVNSEAGTFETNQSLVSSGNVPKDALFLKDGDAGKSGLTSFAQWLPAKSNTNAFTNSSATLHGLDRSLHRARLAGFYSEVADGAPNTLPFTKAFRKMTANIINLSGNAPNKFVCNSLVEDFLAQEQVNNINFNSDNSGGGAIVSVGAGKLQFRHSKGVCEIVTSPFCPISDCYLLDTNTWALHYLGNEGDDFVDFAKNENGGMLIPAYNGAGVEVRVESFGNTTCDAPGRNGRLHLADALYTRIAG